MEYPSIHAVSRKIGQFSDCSLMSERGQKKQKRRTDLANTAPRKLLWSFCVLKTRRNGPCDAILTVHKLEALVFYLLAPFYVWQ
jgi:hypothetical protein